MRETAIQGHSRSSVDVPIDAAYMISCQHSIVTELTYSTSLLISSLVCIYPYSTSF